MVTLVGAGPGDPGLMTRKGLECLRSCEAVIYDRLASEELLKELRPECVRVYVGKQPGAHSVAQEEINRLLVEYGGRYRNVVRLKGGDPFVFGRGGEEIQALDAAGIPWEIVPGVTSAVAVPELAGIPVTHRSVARSFHVITGHGAFGERVAELEDYAALARLHGTLVFLMGLSALSDIADALLRNGKDAKTPAAVIAEGTTPGQRVVRGTLFDIAKRVAEEGLASPAVIVVGETAGLSLMPQESREGAAERQAGEAGKRTLGAVGTRQTVRAFREALRRCERGEHIPCEVTVPVEMEVCDAEDGARLSEEISHIRSYDWVLFTSKQAVECFFAAFRSAGEDVRTLAGCRFGVIGAGTGGALAAHGIRADLMPEHADAAAFAAQLSERFRAKRMRVLFPRARQGNGTLAEELARAGAEVCALSVYDVRGRRRQAFAQIGTQREFVFFSASGVRAFFAELAAGGTRLSPGSVCYCMGTSAAQALQEEMGNGEEIRVVLADEPTVRSLAERVYREEREGWIG